MIEQDKQKQENEKKNADRAMWYKRMASTKDGKKIMADLAEYCNYNKTSVCRQQPNPDQTMFCEGMRAVFLYINEKVNRKEKKDG